MVIEGEVIVVGDVDSPDGAARRGRLRGALPAAPPPPADRRPGRAPSPCRPSRCRSAPDMLRAGLLVDVDSIPADAVLVDTRLALSGPTGRERYDAGHVPGAAYLDVDDDLAAPPGLGGATPAPRRGSLRGRRTPCGHLGRFARGRVRRRSGHRGGPPLVVAPGSRPRRRPGPGRRVRRLDRRRQPVSTEPVVPGRATGTAHPVTCRPRRRAGRPWRATVSCWTSAPPSGSAASTSRSTRSPATSRARHAPLSGNTDQLGRFLPDDELRRRFEALRVVAGVAPAAYCGSGVTRPRPCWRSGSPASSAALYPGAGAAGSPTPRARRHRRLTRRAGAGDPVFPGTLLGGTS